MRVHAVTRGPLFPDDSAFATRMQRRAKGIAVEVGGLVLVTVLFPILLGAAVAVDLVLWLVRRKPWMAVRLLAFAWWFLLGEVRALLGILRVYLLTGGPFGRGSLRRRRLIYDLRIAWAQRILGGVTRLFGLSWEVEDVEVAGPGPVLIFIRHASIIDNTMPDAIVGDHHGMGLRFVLKRELNMIPIIDIGGRWVPTNFVRRASADAATEVAKLRTIARDLGPGEGVLIYPEGTRHTAEKLAKAQAKIAERQPEVAAHAARLRNLLPPRLRGPLALLDEARGADVVVCGHVGLDGFEYISDIWRGGLVGGTVRVRFWRYPGSEVPEDEHDRIAWLYEKWQVLDDWVGEQRAQGYITAT